jgi:hypothetical protein
MVEVGKREGNGKVERRAKSKVTKVTKVAEITMYKANMAENTEEISPTR